MFWVMVVVVGVVVFGVAAVAVGQGGTLAPARPDRPPLAFPATGMVRAPDVLGLRFAVALRGYRMDEVDGVLDRLGAELETRDARIGDLEVRLDAAQVRLRELGGG